MPGEPAVSSPKTRPVTRRTSIRQSLNLASVSKAFADVINKDKDSKDTSKPSKKTKDSRRLSAQVKPSAPRASMGDTRSSSQATIRTATPDSKGTTRRRASAAMNRTSSDEQPPKSESTGDTPKPGILTRAATLRAKNPNIAASSLPKYRPKSTASEHLKPPSPVTVRAGTRRRFSSSDEDEKEDKQKSRTPTAASSMDKGARPISPLPQRAALKALNTNPTPTPPTSTQKVPTGTPTSNRGSPTRPAKTFKTSVSAVSRSSPTISANPRPPSSSSSGSIPPQTPKTPVVKPNLRRAAQDKNQRSSPSPAPHPDSPSPPARHARSQSKANNPAVGNMSHISEGADEDEDELDDVELLLAPVAKLGAPTPAMPRIQKSRSRKPPTLPPKTPSRGAQLPTRSNMSYLSPLPPGDGDSNHLRPPQPRQPGSNARNAGRGSILSWEQLASEASKTLGEDELEKMLADIPAPFRSGAASPALSATLEIPASPCLSSLDSPTGYGSISQVLLPDVTPSPAMHGSQRYSLPSTSENDAVNSPVITLLRLQLAQAENMAKERLMQMHAMEQEIHSLQESHLRQMQETARHIAYLEANERNGEEQMAYASSLEDRLRHAEILRENAVREAKKKSEESVRRSCDLERRQEKAALEVNCTARLAASEWSNVKDLTEVELDLVRGDRAVLSVLLADLDQLAQKISL